MLLKSPYTHPLCPAYQLRWTPWTSDGFFKTRLHPFKCVKLPAAPLNCRIQSRALCTRCEVEPFDRSFTDVLNEVFSHTQNNPDNLKPHRKNKKKGGERGKKKIVSAIGLAEEKRLALVANRTDQKLLNNCFPRVMRWAGEGLGHSWRQTQPWNGQPPSGTNWAHLATKVLYRDQQCEGRCGVRAPGARPAQPLPPSATPTRPPQPGLCKAGFCSGGWCRWAVPAHSHLGKAASTLQHRRLRRAPAPGPPHPFGHPTPTSSSRARSKPPALEQPRLAPPGGLGHVVEAKFVTEVPEGAVNDLITQGQPQPWPCLLGLQQLPSSATISIYQHTRGKKTPF